MTPLSQILNRRFDGATTCLALMSLGLIQRSGGGWELTDAGRFAFFS